MDREHEILNKICDKSKDEKIVVLENKVYELRLKFLENGRSPYVYDRFCETKKMQAEEIAFLKYQIKNLLKEMKLVLIFGSRILKNNERLVKAVDFTILSEIYMKYLKIFGVSNEIVVREMVREMEDRVDLKALLHVKT